MATYSDESERLDLLIGRADTLIARAEVLVSAQQFTVVHDGIVVDSKDENGNALVILAQLAGETVQILTCAYDSDGDFLSSVLSLPA